MSEGSFRPRMSFKGGRPPEAALGPPSMADGPGDRADRLAEGATNRVDRTADCATNVPGGIAECAAGGSGRIADGACEAATARASRRRRAIGGLSAVAGLRRRNRILRRLAAGIPRRPQYVDQIVRREAGEGDRRAIKEDGIASGTRARRSPAASRSTSRRSKSRGRKPPLWRGAVPSATERARTGLRRRNRTGGDIHRCRAPRSARARARPSSRNSRGRWPRAAAGPAARRHRGAPPAAGGRAPPRAPSRR